MQTECSRLTADLPRTAPWRSRLRTRLRTAARRSLCKLAFSWLFSFSLSPPLRSGFRPRRRLKRPAALIVGVVFRWDCFTTFCSTLINAQGRAKLPQIFSVVKSLLLELGTIRRERRRRTDRNLRIYDRKPQ